NQFPIQSAGKGLINNPAKHFFKIFFFIVNRNNNGQHFKNGYLHKRSFKRADLQDQAETAVVENSSHAAHRHDQKPNPYSSARPFETSSGDSGETSEASQP